MCGGFSIFADFKYLADRFAAQAPSVFYPARYNARPSQDLPVILNTDPDKIHITKWGITAPWKETQLIINTRKDSLDTKAFFRTAFRERRCLILADGFYEWAKTHGKKQPYRFILKTKEPFAFAGIWQQATKSKRPAFTIVTTEPNALVEKIHNRMPVILELHHEKDWLNPDLDPTQLLTMLQPFPARLMDAYPVSPLVNSPAHDSPEIIKPLS
jgi:putative SOS response-associated peptidase YedK